MIWIPLVFSKHISIHSVYIMKRNVFHSDTLEKITSSKDGRDWRVSPLVYSSCTSAMSRTMFISSGRSQGPRVKVIESTAMSPEYP